MEQTRLDRVIGYFSPERAMRRIRARAMMSVVGGFVGGRYDRTSTKSYFANANSADVDTIYDLPTLRARSRDLVRNTPVATGAVETMLTNVIGSGLSLVARPDWKTLGMTEEKAAEWTENVEREFRLWAESAECDITRTQNFYGLQGLAFLSHLESGDCFALLPMSGSTSGKTPYTLRIQLIEADRIENPYGSGITSNYPVNQLAGAQIGQGLPAGSKIVGGVEVDAQGAPVAYHVASQHPGDVAAGERKWTRVPAFGAQTGRRNVVHLFRRTRPGQNRGVPLLAPVIEPLKQLDRYTEAELMAAVISAMFTVFVKTEAGEGLGDTGAQTAGGTKLIDSTKQVGLGNGSIIDLVPGEDVTFANPTRPNATFDAFVEAILRQIGVAIGLPFEVLVKHFTASYSAARAALLQAWQVFKLRRDFMETSFCEPIYEAWMEEAVASGRIDAPGFFDDPLLRCAYLGSEWVGDAPGQIDPLKEIQAAELRTQVGVSDLQSETMELRGKLWTDVHRQQVREKQARVKDGLEAPITALFPEKKVKGEGDNLPAPGTNQEKGDTGT